MMKNINFLILYLGAIKSRLRRQKLRIVKFMKHSNVDTENFIN